MSNKKLVIEQEGGSLTDVEKFIKEHIDDPTKVQVFHTSPTTIAIRVLGMTYDQCVPIEVVQPEEK